MPAVALILLYPLFFLYHSAVAFGWIPAVLGGYYGPIALLLAPLLIIAYIHKITACTLRLNIIDVAFLLYSLYLIAWTMIYWGLGSDYQSRTDVAAQSSTMVFLWVVNYLVFRCIDLRSKILTVVMPVTAVLMFLIVLAFQENGFFYARKLAESTNIDTDSDVVATYQGFSRSALIVGLFFVATVGQRKLAFFIPVWISLMFMLGARSELLGFIVISLTGILIRHKATLPVLLSLPLLAIGLVFNWEFVEKIIHGSRLGSLLDLSSDTSYSARSHQIEFAAERVWDSPLLGDYGSHVLLGSTAEFAHNFISAWVGYGLVGMLGFTTLFIFSSLTLLATLLKSAPHYSEELTFSACAIVFLIIMALTAKPILYPLFPMAWALAAHAINVRDRGMNKTSHILEDVGAEK
ncbi:hypothetical protein H4O09_02645 [Stenotrophomonas sp. W1S232]|uniref:O-antigen ligase domain-containing protein n=1 Tax=Stenotrophomonas koreensis TaxID=266128 RepID=A0A7W3UY38_9GAMM|nr:hypothetical protein [Stenotrophomonas koreensis]MBB1115964.1 hypothetical protein [Stenotrophomonas koreensis]